MATPVECEGVPRDLGRDQGTAFAAEIAAAVGASGLRRLADRLGRGDRETRRWWRDLRRHFPHQSEWLEGQARAAGVPVLALARAACAALGADPGAIALALAGGDGPRLARSAAHGARLCRMRPEGRFASLEVGSPLLTAPWIGVNEGGLALAAIAGVASGGGCVVSPLLLARDCLERFDAVESALAWCLGRPAAGGGSLLLADAGGEIAGVEIGARERRVLRPDAGALLLTGRLVDRPALEKALAAAPRDDLDALLASVLGPRAARAAVRAEPAPRRLSPGFDAPPLRIDGPPSVAR